MHDVFGVAFANIATALDRSEAAAQQLVLRDAAAVAQHSTTYAQLYPYVIPALINGAAGAVVAPRGRPFAVMAFTVADDKITRIDTLLDPERIARLNLGIPPTAEGARSNLAIRPVPP